MVGMSLAKLAASRQKRGATGPGAAEDAIAYPPDSRRRRSPSILMASRPSSSIAPSGCAGTTCSAMGDGPKPPINPVTGHHARSNDPRTWATFDTALAAARRWNLPGIGFVVTRQDPYVGVDIDRCRDPETGNVEHWASDVIAQFRLLHRDHPQFGWRACLDPRGGHGTASRWIGGQTTWLRGDLRG